MKAVYKVIPTDTRQLDTCVAVSFKETDGAVVGRVAEAKKTSIAGTIFLKEIVVFDLKFGQPLYITVSTEPPTGEEGA